MTKPLSATTKLERNPDIVGTRVEDELILMSLESGKFYIITGPSGDVWDKLGTPSEVGALVDHLVAIYDADPATIESQSRDIFEDLLSSNLIRAVSV